MPQLSTSKIQPFSYIESVVQLLSTVALKNCCWWGSRYPGLKGLLLSGGHSSCFYSIGVNDGTNE